MKNKREYDKRHFNCENKRFSWHCLSPSMHIHSNTHNAGFNSFNNNVEVKEIVNEFMNLCFKI